MRARSLKHQAWTDSLEMPPESYYPANNLLYDKRNSLYKTTSNTALHQTSNSRRNSLSNHLHNNGNSRILHRRSSLLSNGSENQPTTINSSVLTNHEDDYVNSQLVANQHGYEPSEIENGMIDNGQLSSYFSTMSVASNTAAVSGNNRPMGNDNEYYKNRNRASSGHLTDYFSNLSHSKDGERNSTHVRAKVSHPNNADNVKSLLSHRDHPHHQFDSQTVSSDTSSIAESADLSEILRAQMNEKRKQIEIERQHEHEKRVSSDHNFRQEVFKTYKAIAHTDSGSDAEIQEIIDSKITYNQHHKEDDDNLTFEIHELNPIRREKSFTSSPKNSSTFVRKNLFSASEELKSSMTGLNYANANDNNYGNTYKSGSNKSSDTESPKITTDNGLSRFEEKPRERSLPETPSPITEPAAKPEEPISTPVAEPEPQQPQVAPPVATTPRRSQWGQPMIPLGGQYQQSPPAWSQAGSYPEPGAWYPGNYPMPQAAAYPPAHTPYGYPAPMVAQPPMRPYSLHVDPHQYSPYAPPPPPPAVYDGTLSMGYIPQPPPAQSNFSPIAPVQPNHGGTFRVAKSASQEMQPIEQSIEQQQPPAESLTPQNHSSPISEKHNESFFISFNTDSKSKPKQQQQQQPVKKVEAKQGLHRTVTQTLVSPNSETSKVKKIADDEIIKELYNVQKPVAPAQPVAFVIPTNTTDMADDLDESQVSFEQSGTAGDGDTCSIATNATHTINEDEMTKKKELIMKQSLRRRAEQEQRRMQKEQELAEKRESDRIKLEQIERKKEEEKAKKAMILEQYKQRKQIAEDNEKNGGMLPVSRSSSTLVLNKSGSVAGSQPPTMRPQRLLSGGKPRPKSIHSAMLGFDSNSSLTCDRLSASRDEIDLVSRHSTSRPQSALSSQLSSAVTTPTGYGEHSFAADLSPFGSGLAVANTTNAGPTSSNFFSTEYNGPKLFVKPSQKSNKTLILNAINVVLAGAVNAESNRRVADV